LDRRLRFGVRVERPGSVIKDYQTVTDFLSSADGRFRCNGTETRPNLEKLRSTPETTPFTVISPRYYLEDAAFLTALEEYGEGQDLLVECAEALRKPRWPIYLGRKACVPTRPVLESLTSEYGGIDDALSRYPWSCLGNEYRVRKEQPSLVLGYVEDPLGDRTLQDAVRTNQARRYDMRQVRRFTVNFE
jgi:CRISPR system Cascade subunit CasD